MDYTEFLGSKIALAPESGRDVEDDLLNQKLFPFQRTLVRWALRKGRAALFTTTGTGKTGMQLEWASQTKERTLILAPLAVAQQTVREGEKFGVPIGYARKQADAGALTITNYEMVDKFDLDQFGAVVLDESSCLKNFTGKWRTELIEACRNVPYRLCCTATPAPNDITEIANHAEFLGVMSRVEMLAAFFVHDDDGWRLKKHAENGPFYKWLASWSMVLQKPSDIGYDDDGYILPPLTIQDSIVESNYIPEGMLFFTGMHGIQDRTAIRKGTLESRVQRTVELVKAEPDESWLIWCGLNAESDALAKALPEATVVEGSQSPDEKAEKLLAFANGQSRVLITKPKIAGMGLNFQVCARTIFVGLNDSYEQYFQCIRRVYRFGQQRPVNVHIVLSDAEHDVMANVKKKEKEAEKMGDELLKHVTEFEKAEIANAGGNFQYKTEQETGNGWTMMLGDSAERMKEIADKSVHLSVFSPPFQSLYTYSNSERDLGNSKSPDEFWRHFSFISSELLRIMKPGRLVCVHVQNLTTKKFQDGYIGLIDFRGETIRHFVQDGFVYHGEVTVDKNPQAAAVRTHSKGLLFVQLHKDASWMRPGLADYILIFRAPGDNDVPIIPDLTNEEWIEWAHPCWYGIKESDTLNAAVARENADERHIAPLQLGVIERCIRLYSNKGETVFSPFGGIGSEPYMAVKLRRQGLAIELKPSYYQTALRNLRNAERLAGGGTLFDELVEENSDDTAADTNAD